MKNIYLLLMGLFAALTNANANQGFYCNHFSGSAANRDAQIVASPDHVARMAKYDVGFYFLDLNMQRTAPYTISGNVLMRTKSLVSSLDTFGVELSALFTIDSVQAALNGGSFQSANFARIASTTAINVVLPFTAALNQMVEVRVYYHGNPQTSTLGPSGGAVFTPTTQYPNIFNASPPYNASTWFPCKQSLTDKADSSWFFITTDTANVAVANGLLQNTVPVGSNKNRWEYKSKYPIDFFLIAFVVGTKSGMAKTTEYFHPTGRTDSMAVNGFGAAINTNTAVDILSKFSSLLGLYPFYDETLGLASVYLGGGMENQTIIAMGNIGTVMEHEIMHQWFGAHVTCASYRDLWLNEGFARWGESLYSELSSANPDSGRIKLCTEYEVGNPLYGANIGTVNVTNANTSIFHYVSDTNSVNSLYGGTGRTAYYEKPAMMINSLRFEINNDSIFFLGLRNYLSQYAGGNARGSDFIDVMETTTGMDLTDFFAGWYYGYGFPTFNIKWNQKNGQLMMEVTETTSSTNTPLIKTSLEVKVLRANADTTLRFYIGQNVSSFNISSSDSVTGFVVDPNQWIANKAGTTTMDTSLIISGIEILKDGSASFHIYPNPTNGTLYISSSLPSGEPMDAELYNAFGQLVHRERISSNRQMNLPTLPQGIYLLQINRSQPIKVMIIE
ncbi:MAG: T9SS type A sorting domain-containing protein [Bacteroidetes bacterium]|nr:T9SS type A sorting domain-containing protein [Bacteroidota bacterium]